jgi:hypothetical protein
MRKLLLYQTGASGLRMVPQGYRLYWGYSGFYKVTDARGCWVVRSLEIRLVTSYASNCISHEARKIQFVRTGGSLTPLFA